MYFSFHPIFKKSFKKLSKKERSKVLEKLDLFAEDEYNPILKNHKLHGEYGEYRSISITGDMRIIYKRLTRNAILLYDLGSHSQLYS